MVDGVVVVGVVIWCVGVVVVWGNVLWVCGDGYVLCCVGCVFVWCGYVVWCVVYSVGVGLGVCG